MIVLIQRIWTRPCRDIRDESRVKLFLQIRNKTGFSWKCKDSDRPQKKLDVAHSYTGQFCSQWISSYISRSKYILKISTFPFSWFLCLSNAILGNLLFKLVIARYPTFIPYLWNSVAKTNSGNGFSIHSLISKKNPRRHFSPTEDYDVYIVDMVLISKPLATQEIQLMVDIKFIQNGKRYADILTSAC